jgi:hypothetical protein
MSKSVRPNPVKEFSLSFSLILFLFPQQGCLGEACELGLLVIFCISFRFSNVQAQACGETASICRPASIPRRLQLQAACSAVGEPFHLESSHILGSRFRSSEIEI